MDIYNVIYENKNFSNAFKYIFFNNKSNNAPYHHLNHMVMVSKWAYIIYLSDLQKRDELKREGVFENLIISCLFHDMNHSMGEENDEYNVKQSIESFKKWYSEYEPKGIDKDIVIQTIKATQYPYVIKDEDLNYLQCIIRDADLLVSHDTDWLNNIIFGLKKEMGVDEMEKMIDGNISFHSNINMRTDFGKNIEWKPLKQLKQLKEILYK